MRRSYPSKFDNSDWDPKFLEAIFSCRDEEEALESIRRRTNYIKAINEWEKKKRREYRKAHPAQHAGPGLGWTKNRICRGCGLNYKRKPTPECPKVQHKMNYERHLKREKEKRNKEKKARAERESEA